MKHALMILALMFVAMPANAQRAGEDGEILSRPICSKIINRSEQTMIGTLSTAPQKTRGGESLTNSQNFRLEAGDKLEFCAAGPFYKGQRLHLVLRTLIPLFDCKTRIDHDIYLDAKEDKYGFKKLSATCD